MPKYCIKAEGRVWLWAVDPSHGEGWLAWEVHDVVDVMVTAGSRGAEARVRFSLRGGAESIRRALPAQPETKGEWTCLHCAVVTAVPVNGYG